MVWYHHWTQQLHRFQENAYFIITITAFILYFIAYLGLSVSAPKYLQTLDNGIKLYICLFLIYRFHPFRKKVEFTELDQKIAFSAGMLLLTSTFLDYFSSFIKDGHDGTHPIHILDHIPEIEIPTELSFFSLF